MAITGKQLFRAADEKQFKRLYVIQFLACRDAVNFEKNCALGWRHHKLQIEDAQCLADMAWQEWMNTIGVRGRLLRMEIYDGCGQQNRMDGSHV